MSKFNAEWSARARTEMVAYFGEAADYVPASTGVAASKTFMKIHIQIGSLDTRDDATFRIGDDQITTEPALSDWIIWRSQKWTIVKTRHLDAGYWELRAFSPEVAG